MIWDYFHTGVNSVKNGILNFFTQPVLTQTAIDAGLTQDSIKRLTQFNKLLNDNVAVTSAYKQTMKGASAETKVMAREVANGTTKIGALSASSKAAALGMNVLGAALNAAFSIGIAWIISKTASGIDRLVHAEENAIKAAKETLETSKSKVEEYQEQQKTIENLIEQYKELRKAENANSPENRSQLLDLQEQITNMVANEANNYGLVIENLDLANGQLEEQLEILKQIERINLANTVDEAETSLYSANKQIEKFSYHKGNSVFGALGFEKNIIEFDSDNLANKNSQKGDKIVNNTLKKLNVGSSELIDKDIDRFYSIKFKQDTTWQERLDALNLVLEALRTSSEYDTSENAELYEEIKKARDEMQKVVSDQLQSAQNFVSLLTQQITSSIDLSEVSSYNDYATRRKGIIDKLKLQDSIQQAIADGVLDQAQIEAVVDNYLSTLNEVSDYYDEWVRRNTNNYENMSDAEKAWAAEQSQHIKSASFAYEDYKDQIEEVEKSVSTLSSAYQKLDDGSITTSDLGSLFKEFPDLVKYSDDTETLKKKIKELNNQNVTNLIKSFVELKSKISDPEQLKQLDGWINYLLKLSDLSAKVSKQVSSADYVKYEEKNIQSIIDKLEKEKDNQNDILDSLKAQKEELENIISQYKQVVDVVTDYIDKSQIEPLEQRKSDVEEYYNAQIEALKTENEERDRNIELQKAQDALANARKTKVRMYNETQGWHTEFDTNAIKNAENELSSLQNEIAIDDLEKQRDSEVKGIEEQIEAWEDYKEQWKEQVEQITKTDEELTASKILGADWHEKIANQDIDVMTNFGSQYQSYNNRLRNQVNVEISNMEKAIKSRENEIAEWKDYKTQLSNINTSITESNDTYLQSLNQFIIDENSTWEQRIEHMRRNAQIIAELNGQASEVPEIDAESALTGSNLWGIARDGNVLKLYTSESEAKADKENIVKDLVRKQIAPGMPSDVIETITKRIMESLEIKQYARGGINTNTGLAWLDGTKANSEVIFNSAQAKQLYDIVRNGNYGEMISKNILNNINNQSALSARENANRPQVTQSINVTFPNATINAKDYDSFKGFMDRYTNDLLLKMQVGL